MENLGLRWLERANWVTLVPRKERIINEQTPQQPTWETLDMGDALHENRGQVLFGALLSEYQEDEECGRSA